MQIQEALARYVVQLEADGRSVHTVGQVRRHVRLFGKWIGDVEVDVVRHECVAAFLASETVTRTANGASRMPTSANALRSSLRCFFSYCHASGLTSVHAAKLVRRARCGPSRPRALSEADQAKLVAVLEQARTPAERRDKVLFQLLLRAGLRIGSAIALDVEDLDLDAGEMRLRRLKGQGTDVAFMPVQVADLLRELVGTRTSGPVFLGTHGGRIGTRQAARRLMLCARRGGISNRVHPHGLRHAFALRVYARTGDLLITARALNHASIASTQTYARPSPAAVRAAVAF